MKKNRKIILILVLAFIVAVIGGVALYFYLTPQKTTVYVFKQNLSAGTVVTMDMLTPVQADSDVFFGGARSETSSVFVTGENVSEIIKSGDSLRTDVVKGMPFTISLLSSGGGSKIEMEMDPTKIAITIPISNTTGVTDELKNGSRVNIYVTGEGIGENSTYSTKLIFQNMRILAVGRNENTLTTATLETTIDESLKLVYYASTYSLYLGLVDGASYQYSNVSEPYFTPDSGAISGNVQDMDYDSELEEEPLDDSNNENNKEKTTESSSEEATTEK